MRWVGHIACMGRGEAYTGLCWGNQSEGDHLQDPGVDEKVILRWSLRRWDVGLWTKSIWLRVGIGGGRALVNAVMNILFQ